MFNDTEEGKTNYCPACVEWSEKCEKLQKEKEALTQLLKTHLDKHGDICGCKFKEALKEGEHG